MDFKTFHSQFYVEWQIKIPVHCTIDELLPKLYIKNELKVHSTEQLILFQQYIVC